jgi:hypothetical protein
MLLQMDESAIDMHLNTTASQTGAYHAASAGYDLRPRRARGEGQAEITLTMLI